MDGSTEIRALLSAEQVQAGLQRISQEILGQPRSAGQLVLIGVRRGGVPVVEALAPLLQAETGAAIVVGSVDITLYRDDAATALPNPRIGPSEIPIDVTGTRVILVDDVLYTRRTIRAAIDAVMDFGRPANIELMVVVDRSGRQLPIQPDYRVIRVEDIGDHERIDVITEPEKGMTAVIQPAGAPSLPPPQPPEESQ